MVIMSPICGPFGSWSYMNRQLYPETWEESRDYALKLSTCCAVVVLPQFGDGRDWLNGQPTASDLYVYNIWPKVREHPRTVVGSFHMCQMGARTAEGGHVNKPTSLWASDDDLIYYVDGLKCGDIEGACDGNHIMLRGADAAASQV